MSKNPYSQKLQEFSEHAWDQLEAERIPKGAWKSYFQDRRGCPIQKLILEVGCSNAEFLCAVAKKNPDAGFVGLDWKFKILYKGAQRIAREKTGNAALIRGLVQRSGVFFSEGEIDEIWILFPDPWAKKSQLKNRIMTEEILGSLAKLLKQGGKIHFKTDHPGYYQWVFALLGAEVPPIEGYKPGKMEGQRGRHIKQTRVRLTMGNIEGDQPKRSRKLPEIFNLEVATAADALYSGVKTLFEKVFEKEKLPVYELVLRKR